MPEIGIDEWRAALQKLQPDLPPTTTDQQLDFVIDAREQGYLWSKILDTIYDLWRIEIKETTLKTRVQRRMRQRER